MDGNQTKVCVFYLNQSVVQVLFHSSLMPYFVARSDPVVETVGISTFDFSVIGILELSSGHLLINTDEASMTGDVNVQGVISTTSQGTSLAVFNFMSVYLVSSFLKLSNSLQSIIDT